ncbi:MAG: DEAD/DEAH box helicase family protein [Solirubrobacteraceae bacterium]
MAAPLPPAADIARAEQFTRERFVHEGEDAAVALGAGSARRRALDAALAEIAQGLDYPSPEWRRAYSLLLGLERLLSEEEPHLADGTLLNPHQVDALSGTLTALLAAALGPNGSASSNGHGGNGSLVVAPGLEEAYAGSPAVPGEEEIDEELPEDEEPQDWDEPRASDWEQLAEQPEDPNAHKRFWFEHATGAGKTVAALGFVEASRTGGVLILTHRRNLVDQFLGELRDRGYRDRIHGPLMQGDREPRNGPVTVETYQWFVRNAGRISSAYTIVICDEAHTALGEKTSSAIRDWTGPIFVGMTATGALIARHVTDLFPTQTSRFDLAQAARRGVIAPLRCIRIPPGAGVRSIAKVPLRRGDVDVEFDQEMLAELLDQLPFNLAVANLYKTRFNGVPGVVYAAGVRHAYNVAEAFRDEGLKAMAVSGETPKRELANILSRYERGDIDVLVNAQLLAEGWNSPRATVCMHLAPTASKRIYQQRVGRVTRRHPGKESGIVVDFVHPATKHDDPVVTLHSLLDRDVYRGGAIVVGPVRRGRGRRVRVERRVLPVTADPERRAQVFERELWRIAVEHLDWGEQHVWAALAGARVQPSGWRRARAMLHFDRSGELKRRFLLTAVQRNKSSQLRIRALQEIAAAKDAEAFDLAIDEIGQWSRDERREAVKVCLQALAEKRIGRRDQANAWIWRMAEYTRDVHEEYAVQRWPETKRLLGLLVNSSGGAHARNARRLVHASRKQDRRLSAALLAAALAHTPEAEEVLRGARTRLSRKPNSLARDLLRNFPKKRTRGNRRRRRKGEDAVLETTEALETTTALDDDELEADEEAAVAVELSGDGEASSETASGEPTGDGRASAEPIASAEPTGDRASAEETEPTAGAEAATPAQSAAVAGESDAAALAEIAAAAAAVREARGGDQAADAEAAPAKKPTPRRRTTTAKKPATRRTTAAKKPAVAEIEAGVATPDAGSPPEPAKKPTTRRATVKVADAEADAPETEAAQPAKKPSTRRRTTTASAAEAAAPPADQPGAEEKPTPRRRTTTAKSTAAKAPATRRRTTAKAAAAETAPAAEAPAETSVATASEDTPVKKPAPRRRTTTANSAGAAAGEPPAAEAAEPVKKPAPRRAATAKSASAAAAAEPVTKPATRRRTTAAKSAGAAAAEPPGAEAAEPAKKPATRRRATAAKSAGAAAGEPPGAEAAEPAKKPAPRRRATAAKSAGAAAAAGRPRSRPRRRTTTAKSASAAAAEPAA